jgi:hypothetical protein
MPFDNTVTTSRSNVGSRQVGDSASNEMKTYSVTLRPMTETRYRNIFGIEKDSNKFGSGVSVKWDAAGSIERPYENVRDIPEDLQVEREEVDSAWITGGQITTTVAPTFVPFKSGKHPGGHCLF